jgi:hypothetical protein
MIDEAMAQPDDRLHQALRPAMKTRHRDGSARRAAVDHLDGGSGGRV